jgi:hypothetical protein
VEDNRGDIEDYRNRYGYDEKEAEAAYHVAPLWPSALLRDGEGL